MKIFPWRSALVKSVGMQPVKPGHFMALSVIHLVRMCVRMSICMYYKVQRSRVITCQGRTVSPTVVGESDSQTIVFSFNKAIFPQELAGEGRPQAVMSLQRTVTCCPFSHQCGPSLQLSDLASGLMWFGSPFSIPF